MHILEESRVPCVLPDEKNMGVVTNLETVWKDRMAERLSETWHGAGGAEFVLLLLAVRHEFEERTARAGVKGRSVMDARELIENQPVDWDELYYRAGAHRIRPQMAALIRGIKSVRIPPAFRDRIDDYCRGNLSLQLRTISEFTRIKEILDGAGIEAVPFKGFWLAQEFYGDLAARESGDLDLFFHFRDFDRVTVLMAENGYTPETSSSPTFIKNVKRLSAEYNFERYEHGEKVLHVEFHWRMGSVFHGLDITLDELAPHVVQGVIDGRPYPVFTPSANLLLVLMHHGGKDPLSRLKYFSDIAMLLRTPDAFDTEWIRKMARRYRMEKLLRVEMILTEHFTGVKVPEALISKDAGVRKIAKERMRVIEASPEQWNGRMAEFSNLLYQLRTRSGFALRARMVYESFRSAVVRTISPEWLMRAYLKRRYNIERP